MAARNARIRAAISQCPTPVASAITPRQIHSTKKLTRPEALRLSIAVTSNSSAIRKPAMLMTESERVTIEPAISFAFGRPKDLKTPKAAGATTAPKNNAAPNQQASRISREKLRIAQSFLIKIIQRRQQPDLGRNDLRRRQLSRVGRGQQPRQRGVELSLILVEIQRHENTHTQTRKLFLRS